ncbi:cysteine-rich receptor-like protein kinase 15 isoform X2 [Nicotiana sylvestris]|uniref:non-specific serine/threonine protein kinase n=1 Tax=Nicotiana sylvestris TaxID=4096 RepID=A0A1U7XX50_NICSY|nr:PREDICTED: cysteine-rich receptor-like protein kinase 15 isoform X2 [Nicotiana sylvestris]
MASALALSSSRTTLIFLLLSLLVLSNILVGVKPIENRFLASFCSTNSSDYTEGSKFQSNLNRLLYRSLYNNGGNFIYAKASEGEDPDKVHGVFLCRGDVAPKDCQSCIDEATEEILSACALKKQAIVWYDECLIRYSNVSFASTLDYSGGFILYNTRNVSRPKQFMGILGAMFDNLTYQATSVNPNLKYAANSDEFEPIQKLYGMVQCLPNLSAADCRACLNTALSAISTLLSDARVPRGCRVLYASCNLRYELYQFLNPAGREPSTSQGNKDKGNPGGQGPGAPQRSTSQGNEDKGGNTSKTELISIIIGVIALLAVVLAGTSFYHVKRRRRIAKEGDESNQETQLLNMIEETLTEDFSNDDFSSEKQARSKEFPVVKLDLIRAATQNFSEENKLGEGGFGTVYKGKLANGIAIAIKRLSRASGQGLKEFKNEVILIARLQHRNLVRLLGCCLEGNEALLIYEFMPNKNSRENKILDWRQRLHIIKGIARGILYLHEDSRLRIIHRDVKASNVLLDKDMNPKISDFGMAKMFCENQCEANTNRVVGTYGYMSPEYAMEGLFSTKSDVFSFGVLVLEIVSGRKNNGYVSEYGQSLLNFAWKLWCEGKGLELMDPGLSQSCVAADITKCIHIGLLCVQQDPTDRPTMSSAVFMLENDPQTLPQPSQPAFSIGRIVVRSADQPPSNDHLCSVNDVTLSIQSPR